VSPPASDPHGADGVLASDATSWVESAQEAGTDFPLQNLPFGVFSRRTGRTTPCIGVAIGHSVLDLAAALRRGLVTGLPNDVADACGEPTLNDLMSLGRDGARLVRAAVGRLLRSDTTEGRDAARHAGEILVSQHAVDMRVPATIGDYTDFYASIAHATNVGSMFRPDNPLLPNYKYVPIGYHGRASSIVVSGTPVVRPCGQTRNDAAAPPVFGPTRRLDYELEIGAFVGHGTTLGEPIAIDHAEDHLFGLCIVNDWSARDIQAWEYQPLGPFLAKNFATTISPWVVTLDALEPFRVAPTPRPADDPAPLPYLTGEADRARGAFDLTLGVWITSARMREESVPPMRLTRVSFTAMYWTMAQLVTHHASNGCNLRPGDLLASGTVSGDSKDARGSLLELAWRGTEPVTLPTGETRAFIEDGDEIIMRAIGERDGYRRIGFGESRGIVGPGHAPDRL
jgi:fumarylacetoacetase